MNRLEEILNEHIEGGPGAYGRLYDDILEWGRQSCEKTLEKAAKNSMIITDGIIDEFHTSFNSDSSASSSTSVHEPSITNKENIQLL